jgi:outer membrane protein TolC
VAVATGLFLTACAVKPEPLTQAQNDAFARTSLLQATAANEPVTRPIDFHEAVARALKYNLDQRVELVQQALRGRELELSTYQGLPSLVASSGYMGRDVPLATSSESILTHRQSLEPSFSSDRNSVSAELALSWNVLDFGLSYVRAKQAADQVMIQSEMRRKVLNRLVEDVRTAYWRALASEHMASRLSALERRAQAAIADSRKLFADRQTSPTVALTYERELVDIKREAQRVEGELSLARGQLAALMNLPPTVKFRLVAPKGSPALRLPSAKGSDLVRLALQNRSEMREVSYRLRINEREADAALLELLPNFSPFIGANVDSNSFLYNANWVAWGAKASWNLMKVFQYPAKKDVVEAQDELLKTRGMAVAMAVMTQVHASRVRFAHAARELATADQYLGVQRRLLTQIRASSAAEATSQQTLIREEMNSLVAEVKRDLAYANLQNAYANVYASIGLDAFPSFALDSVSVAELSGYLRKTWVGRGALLQARLRTPDGEATGSIAKAEAGSDAKSDVTGSIVRIDSKAAAKVGDKGDAKSDVKIDVAKIDSPAAASEPNADATAASPLASAPSEGLDPVRN